MLKKLLLTVAILVIVAGIAGAAGVVYESTTSEEPVDESPNNRETNQETERLRPVNDRQENSNM